MEPRIFDRLERPTVVVGRNHYFRGRELLAQGLGNRREVSDIECNEDGEPRCLEYARPGCESLANDNRDIGLGELAERGISAGDRSPG